MAASPSPLTVSSPGCYQLRGTIALNAITAVAATAAARLREQAQRGDGVAEIDLAELESTTSAVLALLLECAEIARERSIRLTYRHLPEPLARLAALSNVLALLPLSPTQND
jgi:phospholipid transport system transporter-binding protein